jgi:hypothetical protein|tara:strand:+ start:182 stop:724 length:543 start_codon:yes stop_codon:yes gene_type:complete
MSKYFDAFPRMNYNLSGVGDNTKLVTDIFRRVKVRSKIKDNVSMLDKYDVHEGERPEDVAYKAYGSTDYFWVITLLNNIVNRYYDWPLDEYVFQQYCKDKYDNAEGIHHYERTQDSGPQTSNGPADYSHKMECNSTDAGAEVVSNIQYERRLQDKKRQIQILLPQYLPAVEDEFIKLVRR